jgi:hypothetical protein
MAEGLAVMALCGPTQASCPHGSVRLSCCFERRHSIHPARSELGSGKR